MQKIPQAATSTQLRNVQVLKSSECSTAGKVVVPFPEGSHARGAAECCAALPCLGHHPKMCVGLDATALSLHSHIPQR